jgi:hypothetical protein
MGKLLFEKLGFLLSTKGGMLLNVKSVKKLKKSKTFCFHIVVKIK